MQALLIVLLSLGHEPKTAEPLITLDKAQLSVITRDFTDLPVQKTVPYDHVSNPSDRDHRNKTFPVENGLVREKLCP